MRWLTRAAVMLALCFGALLATAGTPGSFRGIVVSLHRSGAHHWIVVDSRNGMSRRVEISKARITYDEDVPAAEQHGNPRDALLAGAEVRITAEEDGSGGWRATLVEILKAAAGGRH